MIFLFRYGYVINADGNTGNQCVVEPECLNGVKKVTGCLKPEFLEAVIDKFTHLLFTDGNTKSGGAVIPLIEETEFFGNSIVENETSRCSYNKTVSGYFYLDKVVYAHLFQCVSKHHFIIIRISMELGGIQCVFLFFIFFDNRQVVRSENHILGWDGHRFSVFSGQNIIDRQHQCSCFRLCFYGKRQVARHLVTVKVRIVAGAHERMQFNRSAFPENRFKGLNAQTVKRRCTVKKYGMFFDNIAQYVPHFRC